MFAARNRVGTRCWATLRRWLWVCSFILAFSTWLPASAQTAAPNTVVLPPVQLHMPLVRGEATLASECPETSSNVYATQPILGSPRNPNRPPTFDPDLNLVMRGYRSATAQLQLIAINGPTDDDAPQLAYLFRPQRVPIFPAVYQVYDWNWACCPGGEVGGPIEQPEVTLLEMATTPGEAIYPPGRNANVRRDYVALVLFAEQFRITITYTGEDTPAIGYVVHIENVCVDPNLLALYKEMNAEGREDLPALLRSDIIGISHSASVLVAVRDTGSFMDPRSGKDWWQDTVRAMLAAQTVATETAATETVATE